MNLISKILELSPLIWPIKPNGLYVYNYHRIGDPNKTAFDPNVFSCSETMFEKHVQFYNANFDVVSIGELTKLIKQNVKIKEKLALITFDDGYIDNYQLAFPILKKLNTPASFFIATDFIDHNVLPWWDEIAFIIKHCQQQQIKMPRWPAPLNLTGLSESDKIRFVLKQIKADASMSMAEKISQLKSAVNWQQTKSLPDRELFMSWQQIKKMHDNGMDIGSQSCSHRIMSHLSAEEQRQEARQSKERIEEEICDKISSFTYPVGGTHAFNKTTMQILEEEGYQIAFSFIAGINHKINTDNIFKLARFSVDSNCTVQELKRRVNKATISHYLK